MNVYIICPVRNASAEQTAQLRAYKQQLKDAGHDAYYPADDNPYEQTDKIGFGICVENQRAINKSNEVHIFWDPDSRGSLFDLGIAFALKKPIKIVNTVTPTEGKSFSNMLLKWQELCGSD